MEASERGLFFESLEGALSSLGWETDGEVLRKCGVYYDLLIDWNARMNLTRIEDAKDAAEKHFADSLLPLCFGLLPEGASAIDVGTGAGFPGVVLAIVRPDLRMTLLDSLQKRLGFLRELCDAVGVQADFVHARAEDGGRDPALRGRFDLALSRALAPAPVLMELVLPFLKRGGSALCYKGGGAKEEFEGAKKALLRLNGKLDAIREKSCAWGERSIVVVKQADLVPKAYPRRAGMPSKDPL